MSSSSNWSTKKLIGFSLFTTLLFLLLIELSFRIFFWVQWYPLNTRLSVQGSPRLCSDSTLIWNNRPFYLEYHKESQYNALGMRVATGEYNMPEKQANDFWVFLLGGSAMAGMGSNINGEWLDITGVFNHPIEQAIDGYLQTLLQAQMPGKRVKVFNAAITSTTILQSFWNYQRLKQYKPDWVVSLDGVNEPKSLARGQSVKQYLENDWANDPSNHRPITIYTALTTRSAFLNTLKKYLFFSQLNLRLKQSKTQEALRQWYSYKALPLVYDEDYSKIAPAVDSFLNTLLLFKQTLHQDGQKHLLLVQPHLSLRDSSFMAQPEKAVFNYYTSQDYAPTNQFFKLMYPKIEQLSHQDSCIQTMNWVHRLDEWVFVDYCHFTANANKRIAEHICAQILRGE